MAALVEPAGRMLDVGCGDGTLLAYLAARFERTVGIDVASVKVRAGVIHAATHGLKATSFLIANVDVGLPVRDATFDVATTVAVLGFIYDPLALLSELHRVLRPGGQLVVEVLNLAYLPRRLALLAGRLPRHSKAPGWDGGHLHNFTLAALSDALHAHGFDVERWTGSGIAAPWRAWWPSLLTGNLIVACRRL